MGAHKDLCPSLRPICVHVPWRVAGVGHWMRNISEREGVSSGREAVHCGLPYRLRTRCVFHTKSTSSTMSTSSAVLSVTVGNIQGKDWKLDARHENTFLNWSLWFYPFSAEKSWTPPNYKRYRSPWAPVVAGGSWGPRLFVETNLCACTFDGRGPLLNSQWFQKQSTCTGGECSEHIFRKVRNVCEGRTSMKQVCVYGIHKTSVRWCLHYPYKFKY